MKKWKQYSLFLLLLVSGFLLTGAGAAGEHTIYADYSRQNGWMTPALSLVFQGLKDGIGPWELLSGPVQTAAEPETEGQESGAGSGEEETAAGNGSGGEETDSATAGNDVSGNAVSGNAVSENMVSGNSVSENSPSGDSGISGQTPENGEGQNPDFPDPAFTTADGSQYDQFGQLIESGQENTAVSNGMPEEITETTPVETNQTQTEEENVQQSESSQSDGAQPENGQSENGQQTGSFTQVPESYFDDALFIGDSRTVGLDEYGGFQESTTFFAKTSLTIYDLFEEPEKFAQLADGTKATLEEALTERKFGKIYIMLGINELGRGTTESFFNVYADAVNRIRMLQPDAVIFIQGIMRVGEEKNNTDAIFNNTNINGRNQAISLMADNRTIFYLEVNDAVCDENGNLISDYTFDQIHLKAKYYQLWKDYLFAHGIVRD